MYRVSVSEEFIAQHYLIGGDWGDENHLHSHHFKLAFELEGRQLNQHGYLFDISILQTILNETIKRYRDQTLNELEEFNGLNPSIENFARIIGDRVALILDSPNLELLTVRIWEDENPWCSYSLRPHEIHDAPMIFQN